MPESKKTGMAHVAAMPWDDFQEKLLPATRATKRGSEDEKAMRLYFGDAEFEELQRLAGLARATPPEAKRGTIVFLPGIMGSNLVTVDKGGDEDLVWVHFVRLALGGFQRLRLGDGPTAPVVRATLIDKRTYARALLKLGVRWNVVPFAFDWREDINEASKALGELLAGRLRGKPVHLVAHSMGGLVCRNFIRLHCDTLWKAMRTEAEGFQGGRLIMLGTPNFGSFTIPQVLTGTEKLIHWLSLVDLEHSIDELLEIISTFPGVYQMLPAPSKVPDFLQTLYGKDIWGRYPVLREHLGRAFDFHAGLLETKSTVDPSRMAYIAGCNQQTLSGMKIIAPGEFEYTTTRDGDGRVPFSLGLLEGVPTYYVEEAHGSLPRNDLVLKAVDELLERGTTSVLPDRPIQARAIVPEGGLWHRSIAEHKIGADLERIARKAKRDEADPDELRAAEETLMRAVIGGGQPARTLAKVKEEKERRAPAGRRVALSIEVACGDITQVSAPVIVTGHYRGIAPSGAEKALDLVLDHWISRAVENSMIGSELGQMFFIPVTRRQLSAEAVLLAGMGEEGRFSRHDLRYLMLNVTGAIAALGMDGFAAVLIGSGGGNLKEDVALRAMLFGICDALHRLPDGKKLERVILVHHNEQRCERLFETLQAVKSEDSAARLDIRLSRKTLSKPVIEVEESPVWPEDLPERRAATRITIEREEDLFRFSALTPGAVIPVREVEVQPFFPDSISERLMLSTTKEEQETYGRLLNTTIFPEEFQQLFHTDDPLTFILDRSTASIPWEMVCFDRPEGPAFLGTHVSLTRQFRTFLSPAPGIAPQLNETLRVLVVADPAPEPELQLPGARREGREIARILHVIKSKYDLDIQVVDRIGAAECDPVEVLALILEGGFDVVHFSGHGVFNREKPSRGGWVFGKDRFLSAREIFRARRVPRLVFANACFSAVVNRGEAFNPNEMNRQLAGIAEAFFERGVQNYIGAGWPVRDDLAVTFARAFYAFTTAGRLPEESQANAVGGRGKKARASARQAEPKPLAEALCRARTLILHDGSTWGAYHHYGQGNALLIRPPGAARQK